MARFNPQNAILKVRQGEYAIQRQNEPSINAINKLTDNPLVSSNLIEGVEISIPTGAQQITLDKDLARVRHKLGRVFQGWTVTCISRGDVRIFEELVNDSKETVLKLNARLDAVAPSPGVTIEVNILVF